MRRVSGVISAMCSGSDLSIIVHLDGAIVAQHAFTEASTELIPFEFDDQGDHELSVHMQGKLPHHTRMDATGIVEDRVITLGLQLAEWDLRDMLPRLALYRHDNNGASPTVTEPFQGVMGCNGRVTVRFSSPVRLWLLEKEQE